MTVNQRPKVLAYYFPNWHVDPENERLHGEGWTEWELVRSARPRFTGHHQPRIPALGEQDESDPAVMAVSIDLARAHGIDGFIFDYYWYDQKPYLQRALEEGFLGAENSTDLEFSLMWANHEWVNLFPSPTPDEAGRPLRSADIDRAEFERFATYVIEHYFTRPNYTLIDGRPRFSIYEINTLIEGLGGVEATRDALDWFDARVREAGFPGLHLDLVVWAFAVLPSAGIVEDPSELVTALGARSASSYVWIHHLAHDGSTEVPAEWAEVGDRAFAVYADYLRDLPVPFHPNVTVGWDSTPRTAQDVEFRAGIYPWGQPWAPSVEGFRHGLELARDFVAAQPPGYREVTINAWNEWTEGSYLLPDDAFGTRALEAVHEVFEVRATNRPVADDAAGAAADA